jgi:hypothetical protein
MLLVGEYNTTDLWQTVLKNKFDCAIVSTMIEATEWLKDNDAKGILICENLAITSTNRHQESYPSVFDVDPYQRGAVLVEHIRQENLTPFTTPIYFYTDNAGKYSDTPPSGVTTVINSDKPLTEQIRLPTNPVVGRKY